MVETARLESVLALTGYEGSNPSFSAIFQKQRASRKRGLLFLECEKIGIRTVKIAVAMRSPVESAARCGARDVRHKGARRPGGM